MSGDRDSERWWQGLAENEPRLQRCDSCRAYRWPPRAICNRCASFDASWERTSLTGTVASWSVTRHAFTANVPTPHTVVVARLSEQEDLFVWGAFQGDERALRVGRPIAGTIQVPADGTGEAASIVWSVPPDSTST